MRPRFGVLAEKLLEKKKKGLKKCEREKKKESKVKWGAGKILDC
jgi:hypothetical protein